MKKRNREQLRAANANDLVKGQGGHSPTRELLRQYVPLEGIIAQSPPDKLQHTRRAEPVENSLAPHATNKYDDDDDKIKRKSSSKEKTIGDSSEPVENHRRGCAARETSEFRPGFCACLRRL